MSSYPSCLPFSDNGTSVEPRLRCTCVGAELEVTSSSGCTGRFQHSVKTERFPLTLLVISISDVFRVHITVISPFLNTVLGLDVSQRPLLQRKQRMCRCWQRPYPGPGSAGGRSYSVRPTSALHQGFAATAQCFHGSR